MDWYAQDKSSNVWYFGEDCKTLDAQGNVASTEGSWEAGVKGAQPGIIMEAKPKVGDKYQQEFAQGVAQDMAQVLSLTASKSVAFGTFHNDLLKTREHSPLEPSVIEFKFYAKGVDDIYETTADRSEWIQLIQIQH